MKKHLFKSGKNTYKANLHCHTTVSDGTWTPEQTKEAYKSNGYSVVAFSDHNILVNHSHLNDDSFLAINSCEFAVVHRPPGAPLSKLKTYHFNLFSGDPNDSQTPPSMDMKYDDIDAINKYIADRNNEGFLVSYNHPYWSLQTYEDYSKLKGCFAMEIYNHCSEISDGYYGYCPQVYDELLRLDNKIHCLATDDNHKPGDAFGGWVVINGDALTYGNIMDSLKNGDFYSTQGPEIYEISIEGDSLNIKCSDVSLIVVYTDGRACHTKKGEALNEVTFTLRGDEKYIRVMCRDKEGKNANSNAYWL